MPFRFLALIFFFLLPQAAQTPEPQFTIVSDAAKPAKDRPKAAKIVPGSRAGSTGTPACAALTQATPTAAAGCRTLCGFCKGAILTGGGV